MRIISQREIPCSYPDFTKCLRKESPHVGPIPEPTHNYHKQLGPPPRHVAVISLASTSQNGKSTRAEPRRYDSRIATAISEAA